MLRFPAALFAEGSAQRAAGSAFLQPANLRVDRPARAAVLDDRAASVQADVAQLRFAGPGPVINFAVDDQAAPDTASERDVKNGIEPRSRATRGLAKRGDVRIVVDPHRKAGHPAQPLPQFHSGPALDVMGSRDAARAPFHWPAESDADGDGFPPGDQSIQSTFQMPANPCALLRPVDHEPLSIEDGRGLVAHDDLQLGASNFDAQKRRLRADSPD